MGSGRAGPITGANRSAPTATPIRVPIVVAVSSIPASIFPKPLVGLIRADSSGRVTEPRARP